MIGIRTIAALVSNLNGIWIFILGTFWEGLTGSVCTLRTCSHLPLQVLAIVLVVDSLACFLGWSRAFYLSAIVSVVSLFVAALFASTAFTNIGFEATIVLTAVVIALDIAAAIHKARVSEEAHPLNLPVFG